MRFGDNWLMTSPPGSERGDGLVEGRGMALAMPDRVVGRGLGTNWFTTSPPGSERGDGLVFMADFYPNP